MTLLPLLQSKGPCTVAVRYWPLAPYASNVVPEKLQVVEPHSSAHLT